MQAPSLEVLTPREREILALIADGDSLIEIAQKLHRSQKTIESHRLSLGRKLKASNRVELTKIAIANGLVSVGQSLQGEAGATGRFAEQALAWLEQINDHIGNATGARLLERFCQAASKLPGVNFAIVCTPKESSPSGQGPSYRQVMAVAEDGQLGSTLTYDSNKTAYTEVAKHGQVLISSGLQDAYPDDEFVKQIGAESYLGVQLVDAEGRQVGGVGLIGRTKLDRGQELQEVIDFFAPRLVGALQTSLELQELRSKLDLLESESIGSVHGAALVATGTEDRETTHALSQILAQVQARVGADFLRGIVESFAQTFDLSHVGICRLENGAVQAKLKSVIFMIDQTLADTIVYTARDTPCKVTLDKGEYAIGSGAGEAFPKDDLLKKNQVDSYLGVRLPAPNGKIAGLMWVGNRSPIQNTDAIAHACKYFAARLGAELDNQLRIDELMQDREELEAKLRLLNEQAGV